MTSTVTSSKLSRNAMGGGSLLREKKNCPLWIAVLALVCTVVAGLGDWKIINDAYGGLPKAVALGTIACAFLSFLVDADFDNFRKAMKYFPLFLLPIAVYTLITMYIWVTDFSKVASISRASQKLFFLTITVVYSICMCYLFEDRAVNYLFIGMCATNAAIALLEMPRYGVAESISSVVTCLVTFGEAEGFVRALEIHDITFLFGQFFIYFVMFAPKRTPAEKRKRILGIFFAMFFILLGLKRSTLPAVALVCVYVKVLRMFKERRKLVLLTGSILILFFYVYLYLTRSGILVAFLESHGVDMMGRNVLWSLPNDYYELSPFWKGLGFEAVTDLVHMWTRQGFINRPYPLHNDLLRIFIELGALGFTLWAVIHYLLYPTYWMNQHDTETGILYMALLCYMTVTYLTDNTAFYFWSSIGLRVIPMSYSYRNRESREKPQWTAPTPQEAADAVWAIEMEGKFSNVQ